MQTFLKALIDLVLAGLVDREVAANAATNRHDFEIALDRAEKLVLTKQVRAGEVEAPVGPGPAPEPPKGEVTIVLGPGASSRSDIDEAVEAVRLLVAAGAARRAAADVVARLAGAPRNDLYRRSLDAD